MVALSPFTGLVNPYYDEEHENYCNTYYYTSTLEETKREHISVPDRPYKLFQRRVEMARKKWNK